MSAKSTEPDGIFRLSSISSQPIVVNAKTPRPPRKNAKGKISTEHTEAQRAHSGRSPQPKYSIEWQGHPAHAFAYARAGSPATLSTLPPVNAPLHPFSFLRSFC